MTKLSIKLTCQIALILTFLTHSNLSIRAEELPSVPTKTKKEMVVGEKQIPESETEPSQTEESAPVKDDDEVNAVADDLEYVKEENKVIGHGNVYLTRGDTSLTADHAQLYTDTKKAYAEGHVTVRNENIEISGEKVFYDFHNNQGSFPDGRIIADAFYIDGEQIEQVSKDQINILNGILTTCSLSHQHYDLKSSRAVVYPGDKAVLWNIRFRILGVPVFWWPYLVVPLDQETGPIELSFGQSKSFGNYYRVGKAFSVLPPTDGRVIKTKVLVDGYRKRGTAVGNQTWYHLDKIGDGHLLLYDIKDKRAPDPFTFKADDNFQNKERYRATWKHRTDFDQYTNLIAQWNGFSDPHVMNDFFKKEFDKEPVPQSFAVFTTSQRRYGVVLDVQKQANDFDNVLERLPEVRFRWNDQEVKDTGVYYTSETGYVNFHQISHTDTIDPEDGEQKRKITTESRTHESRVDTIHTLSYPKRYFRYYDLTPNVSSEWTYWNRNRLQKDNEVRNVIRLGSELATRFYRFFEVPKGQFLGIKAERVRHYVKPIITYSGTRQVSTRPEHLYAFDGIDQINVADDIRFGLENRIQTKSAGQRIDIVSLNTYANYAFNEENNDSRWKTATGELILRPYSWLQVRSQVNVDLKQHRRTGNDSDIALRTKYVDVSINHRYVLTSKESIAADRFFSRETHILTLNGKARLNERWNFGGYFRWEIKRHNFREYEWFFERDLHDWMVTFGQNIKHTEINWLDHEIFLELRLKAFPDTPFATGRRSQFAEARIGESVSGANTAPPPPSLINR